MDGLSRYADCLPERRCPECKLVGLNAAEELIAVTALNKICDDLDKGVDDPEWDGTIEGAEIPDRAKQLGVPERVIPLVVGSTAVVIEGFCTTSVRYPK